MVSSSAVGGVRLAVAIRLQSSQQDTCDTEHLILAKQKSFKRMPNAQRTPMSCKYKIRGEHNVIQLSHPRSGSAPTVGDKPCGSSYSEALSFKNTQHSLTHSLSLSISLRQHTSGRSHSSQISMAAGVVSALFWCWHYSFSQH